MKSKISIISLFLAFVCFGQNGLHIVFSDKSSLIFEYTPIFSDSSSIKINGEDFLRLAVSCGTTKKTDMGMPQLTGFVLPVGVPSETGNTLQIINSSFIEVQGKLSPVPQLKNNNGTSEEKYVLSDKYFTHNSFNSDLISFDVFGTVRGLPVQNIFISPVQFNSSENKIRIYTRITGKITFSSNQKRNVVPVDELLSSSIINYKDAAQWGAESNSKLKKEIVNSVLSTGKWFRFEAPEEGIYKITKSMLAGYGIDANTIDPRTIKIYNNGGKTLPENPEAPVPTDLVENAIFISGEDDGKFDDADFILFYGRGVNFWEYDTAAGSIQRRFNPYSKENYFWITSGGNPGKRMNGKANLAGTPNFVRNTTPSFIAWDEDKINIGKSGRYAVGDEFAENLKSRTYTNKLDNIVPNSKINYNFQFINSDFNSIQLKVEENSNVLYSNYIPGSGSTYYSDFSVGIATIGSSVFTGSIPDNRSVLKFTFNASGDKSKGYLDYFEIIYNRYLSPSNDQLTFFSPDSTGLVEYDLGGFSNSNISVYDITDNSNVMFISNAFISGGECRFNSNELNHHVSKYLAIGNNAYKTPGAGIQMDNSNLHGESAGAKLLIITTKDFMEQAQRLKSYKESSAPVITSTYVADISKIFNEFSGGIVDISGLRNYIRYAFLNWNIKPESVLLFGDGTYDYKNLEGANSNFILTYETPLSFHLLDSYPMDDYFVRLTGNGLLDDMPIGRLTVNSASDAKTFVDKIIYYDENVEKGDWQSTISLVADDNMTTQGNEGNYHTPQSEDLAAKDIPGYFTLNKIYLGAYPTIITGFGRTKPGVTQAIINSVNAGNLILNYIGHGSPELWAHERVFEKSSTIPQFKNSKYFFLTAATCDFGYYDLPNVQSGAEVLIGKPNSGAIGAFTASRPVFSIDNAALNELFYTNLLMSPKDSLSYPITVGQAYFKTKLVRTIDNDNKFLLFCDPSLRLLVPRYTAVIDSINGIAVNSASAQIKALSSSRVSGHIERNGSIWSGYTGEGVLSVFDSERQVPLPLLDNYVVNYQGGIIYRGRVSINNGYFSSSFAVPKDISYENKNGKIVFFFTSSEDNGIGYTRNLIVGGTDSTAVNDNKGPVISVTFDDAQFKNGYLVNPDSKLIIHLSDETGLNTTGTGIGHKMEGILNDKINDPIDFTNYFTGDLDAGGKSGEVDYKLSGLEEGKYKLQVKAWDIFNNFSTETINFEVVSGNDLEIRDVVNYPNPFSSSTTFTLQQNLNRVFDVNIKIYTVAGRLIRDLKKSAVLDKFVKIDWDGRDEDGSQIANGTYLYKVILKSTDGQYNKSVLGKLAVIR